MATHKEIKSRIKHSIRQVRDVLNKIESMTNGTEIEMLTAFLFTEELIKSLSDGPLSTKSIGKLLEQHINNINNHQKLGNDTDK
jgi:hypothetical protein